MVFFALTFWWRKKNQLNFNISLQFQMQFLSLCNMNEFILLVFVFNSNPKCSRFNMKFSFDCWFRATVDLYYSNQDSLCVFIFLHVQVSHTHTLIHTVPQKDTDIGEYEGSIYGRARRATSFCISMSLHVCDECGCVWTSCQ